MEARATYEQGQQARSREVAALEGRARTIGTVRLAIALAALVMVGGLVWGHFGTWAGGALAALALVFVVFVVLHARVIDAKERAAAALRFHERGLARLAHAWDRLPVTSERFKSSDHPFASDLDVFGRGSIMQLVDATETLFGEERLARLLSLEDPGVWPDDAAARQAAVRDLAGRSAFREALATAGGVLADDKPDPAALLAWAEAKDTLPTWMRALGFVVPGALLVIGVAGPTIGSPVQDALAGRHRRHRARQLGRGAAHARAVRGLGARAGRHALAGDDRGHRARASRGAAARAAAGVAHVRWPQGERRDRGPGAHRGLRRRAPQRGVPAAGRAAAHVGRPLRFSPLAVAGQGGGHVRGWIEALGEIEALASLGGFAFEHPGFAWPELSPDPQLEAKGLGHPLVAEDKRVDNDVSLLAAGRALVVTGSNMSGKSTLLRALGVNAALAIAGAPVCAKSARLGALRVATSMRIEDSLEQGVSHFYAELRRLKRVIDLARLPDRAPVLFLLDEILHGTNSRERVLGACAVVRELVGRNALGAVSTHDLGITALGEELGGKVENVHFEEQVEGGTMTFDYVLRPGIVQSSNALRLMRAVGIDVAPVA